MLLAREPVKSDVDRSADNKNWKALLANSEQLFLTENQLSIFVDRERPGCEQIHFYPLPFAHEFANGKWDFNELICHDSLRSLGPVLDFTPDETELSFLPHRIEKYMKAGKTRVYEKCAVSGNTMAIMWDIEGLDSTTLKFGLPYFEPDVEIFENTVVLSVRDQAFAALAVTGASELSFSPGECRIVLPGGGRLNLALSCGYGRDRVVCAAQDAALDPESIFRAAEETWSDYFTRVVPQFSCSDKRLEKLYYYQAYVTRANLYDIPYEPFTHPYVCPWKSGAVWQWTWNTPMNSICERWLNDKSIGAGGILLESRNGGSLHIGTYLHPVRRVAEMRGHNEHHQTIGRYQNALPSEFDMQACTTLTHTTPNGLLGAWEFFLTAADPEFLREALSMMIEAEAEFSKHETEPGLCTCTFVDEFDYSLRLKPFVRDFTKGDPVLMYKMETPFIAVDYNCYLYALRERIIEAARLTGSMAVGEAVMREKNARLKDAINEYLWDEESGFYYDVDPRNMKISGVKCIGGISALYAGIADRSQAERIVSHLTNPSEFGTPYPCPSISMDTPGVDPSLATYGGDCIITSGIWFTVEGLVRYGYLDLAADYITKTIEMVTKEGPSSSYSYNSITGKYNQEKHTLSSQCNILTDLICKYVIGIVPSKDGRFGIHPLALNRMGVTDFHFGPYRYGDSILTVSYAGGDYEVTVQKNEEVVPGN